MATAKTKAKKAAPKKAAPKRKPKPKKNLGPPAVRVENHRFSPGTEVGFYPAHTVEIERSMGREPFQTAFQTAKVKPNGVLEVKGLTRGIWCAAAPVGDTYAYLQFPANLN